MSHSPKVVALRSALLKNPDPFHTGKCAVPDYQRFLYYTNGEVLSRIDFSNAGLEDLEALYGACKPAEFGLNGENVLDTSYRKARKMEPISFATLFDPRTLGIDAQVSNALLNLSNTTMRMELYKLNVYGKGDFFKVHKDTPRGQDMFGSLVVVLPTPHKGGEFVLRQSKREWTIDFADKLANTAEPSVCFIAFYGDVDHAVLPVTSGYRITLTYNLYHKPIHPTSLSIPTPFHLKLRQTLADLVNDSSVLPRGGYLGFGLIHEYAQTGDNVLGPLLNQLKGSDRALVDACKSLGLRYHIRLLYRGVGEGEIHLLTTKKLDLNDPANEDASPYDYLTEALECLGTGEAEGFVFVGQEDMPDPTELKDEFVWNFYKDPFTEVLEVTDMRSTVDFWCTMVRYGNQAELDYFYGTACMVVAVDPAESRDTFA